MATSKITITLDVEQLKQVRAIVASGKAANISAFVKHAVGVALLDAAGWNLMLSQALEETGGPLMKQERRWADGVLKADRSKSKRSGRAV